MRSYTTHQFIVLAFILTLGGGLAVSSFVWAEDAPPIIVTGTPLAQGIKELPASVSVLTGGEILQSDPSYFQEQIIELPNVNYAGGTSRPRFFQIRGIGELEQYEGAPNSSVAVIVDDVDLTGVGAALTLFDIQQLEVHRGPQPTRFGSSALAGAINVVTMKPTKELSGTTLFSFGNDNLFSVGAAVGGELTKNLLLRASVFGHRQDGFRHNDFFDVDDTNQRDEMTGRVKLLLTPSEDAEFTLTLTNVDIDNGYDVFTIFNGFTTQSDRPGRDEENLKLASLQGDIQLGEDTSLTTTTSFYNTKVDYAFDGDWGNNPFWAPFDPYDFFSDTDRERNVFAHQIRLHGSLPSGNREMSYLAGAFFQSFHEETQTREFSDNSIFDALGSDYQQDTYAVFANGEMPIGENWKILTGGRGEYRDARYRDSRSSFFVPDDVLWGGSATLQYDFSEDVLAYLLVSRGFRGGGFNASPSVPAERVSYGDESLLNIELGTRFTLLDKELQVAFSLFYNRRNNQQVKLALQVDPSDPLSFTFLTDNAARGESVGVEGELTYQVTEAFNIRSTGSLLYTEISSVDVSLAALEGRDQSHAPNWQYSLTGEYYLTDNLATTLGITGRDAFFFDDSNSEKSQSYHLLNAALRYSHSDWDVTLWGRNLTDKKYAVRGFFFGNEPPDFSEKQYVQLGDSRAIGVTWSYFFGKRAA